MFKYKQCSQCGTDNHHKNNHCKKCGKELLAGIKLSVQSFLNIIFAVLILGAVSVYAIDNYHVLLKPSDNINQQQVNQPQVDQPQTEKSPTTKEPEISRSSIKFKNSSEPTRKQADSQVESNVQTLEQERVQLEQDGKQLEKEQLAQKAESKRNTAQIQIDYYNKIIENERGWIKEDMDRQVECIKNTQQWIGTNIFDSEMANCNKIQEAIDKNQEDLGDNQKQADFWLAQKMSY